MFSSYFYENNQLEEIFLALEQQIELYHALSIVLIIFASKLSIV